MALRPELAERIARAEESARRGTMRTAAVEVSIDEVMSNPGIAIPEEIDDIPSVVTRAEELKAEALRVQRESRPPPMRASARYAVAAVKRSRP